MNTTCQIYIEDSTPVYTGGDIVAGYLEVSTTSNEHFNVAVSFEGHTRTWLSVDNLENQVHVVPTAEYQFLQESQFQKFDPSYLHFSNGKLTYQFPFEFTIPTQLTSIDSHYPSELLELPPTLKEGLPLLKNGKTYMQPLITYLVKASVLGLQSTATKKPRTLCSNETEVVIEPTVRPGVGPPREIKASFSMGEHTATCTKSIRRHSWSRPIGELTTTIEEPQPLNISTWSSNASTTLPIILSFHPFHGIIPPNKPGPPNWTFEITTSIQSNTIYSTEKFTAVPTISSTHKDLHTGLHSTSTKPETQEFVEPEWRTWRECLCLEDGDDAVKIDTRDPCWTTVLQVPVSSAKTLLPGYQSMFSATNHTLHVKVKVKGSLHEALELEVPLQVVNDSTLMGKNDWVAAAAGHAPPMMVMDGVDLAMIGGKHIRTTETSLGTFMMV